MPSPSWDGGPTAVPKYQRIAASLRRDLERAAQTPGGRLPSERTLAARYQVNRQTVRAALQRLREDGLIVTERRGTRPAVEALAAPRRTGVPAASPTPPPAPPTPPATKGASTAAPTQSWLTLVTVPPLLAVLLGMRGGDRTLVHHRRVRGPSGETLQHAVTYLCPRVTVEAPELARYRDRAAARDEDLGPLHRWLDRAGEQGRVVETLTMTRSTPAPAAAAAAACGLTVRRTLRDDTGRLLAVTDLSFPTWDRLTFHRDRAVGEFRVS
ncbi:GntR family transcriptional regulator [Streptomyces sp. NPDC006430]|uniref:GntR family transcriptional regulator n=1 Tax=Streptomyces sp. NPDC006430 TaxID=3154299 RepID=UPI0033B1FD02